MCIIFIGINPNEKYSLILAANRDEFYRRESLALAPWASNNQVVSGIDLKSKGTWLGVNKSQHKWIAITNIRRLDLHSDSNKSRGLISRSFLEENWEENDFINMLQTESNQYNPFNLLFGFDENVYAFNSVKNNIKKLSNGIYGLSNDDLDVPWPKIVSGKKNFETLCSNLDSPMQDFFEMLSNTKKANDEALPNTGVPKEWEKALSPIFIKTENYGTVNSSYLSIRNDGVCHFAEYTHLKKSLSSIAFKAKNFK